MKFIVLGIVGVALINPAFADFYTCEVSLSDLDGTPIGSAVVAQEYDGVTRNMKLVKKSITSKKAHFGETLRARQLLITGSIAAEESDIESRFDAQVDVLENRSNLSPKRVSLGHVRVNGIDCKTFRSDAYLVGVTCSRNQSNDFD